MAKEAISHINIPANKYIDEYESEVESEQYD